jgi:hypothetical protein
MIYGNVSYYTEFDANYLDKKWNMVYNIRQGRKNLKGIKEERTISFKLESNKSYDGAYKELMEKAVLELSKYNFDFFTMPDNDFIALKERLEDGKIKNNQITKD